MESIAGVAQKEEDRYQQGEERPLGAYLGVLGVYGAGTAGLLAAVRLTKRGLPAGVSAADLSLMALTARKLARLVAKDPVMSPLRAPFTRFRGVSGPELAEEVRGHGARHSVEELLTCPFRMAQWMAAGYAADLVLAPRVTRLFGATIHGRRGLRLAAACLRVAAATRRAVIEP